MLLFNNITWYSLVAWFVVLGALILINEFARKSKLKKLRKYRKKL